jgi:hypothetical protein
MVLVLNAFQLRAVADAAASLRNPSGGEDAYYLVSHVVHGEDGEKVKLKWVHSNRRPDNAVFGLDTHEVEPRLTPSRVEITCEGATRDLVPTYDAVFWSESAVEKFLLPYYASKSLWDAADVLGKISWYWYGRIPTETSASTHTEDVGETEEPLATPFAMAHTPDSEWTVLDADVPAGHDLHLLIKDGDVVRAVRLSDLPDPPQPGARAGRGGPARRTHAATGGA